MPIDTLADGTNVLIAGEPKTGKQELLFRILAEFVQHDDGFVLVTGQQPTETVINEIESRVDRAINPDKTAVTEIVSGPRERTDARSISQVVTAGDLSGIGISFSTQYRRITEWVGSSVCLAVHSLTSMLMDSELSSVIRLLQVATGTVQNHGGLGVYTVDNPIGSDEVHQFQELVDEVIEMRQRDTGSELRVSGFPEIPREWRSFDY